MSEPLICHCLIGPPGSGKSTVAAQLAARDPQLVIVCPDTIRGRLYGDVHHQGDWQEVEAIALEEIAQAIASGRGVIYDATHVQRAWRMNIMGKVPHAPQAYWVGWQMPTKRNQCLAWNRARDRQVPEAVIHSMWEHYTDTYRAPTEAEGFDYLATTPWEAASQTWLVEAMQQVTAAKVKTSIRARQNKSRNVEPHRYSRLLDFERLIFLVRALIHYPGLGHLHQGKESPLRQVLGSVPEFERSEAEIGAVLHRQHGEIYNDPVAIAADLEFLAAIGLTRADNRAVDLHECLLPHPHNLSHTPGHFATHPYSDRTPMIRLLALLRLIAFQPCTFNLPNQAAPDNENKDGKDPKLNEVLAAALVNQKVYTSGAAIRKDIQNVLRPYRLLSSSRQAFRKGYFLGTGLLNLDDLRTLHGELRANKLFTLPPTDNPEQNIFVRFQERLQYSKLLTKETLASTYPVRRIGNRNIVNPEFLGSFNAHFQEEQIIQAILDGYPLRFELLRHAARFPATPKDPLLEVLTPEHEKSTSVVPPETIEGYPLQLVFHDIAWYVGYERLGDRLMRFERLDRLRVVAPLTHQRRSPTKQAQALKDLTTLHAASAGLYLGVSATDQQAFLQGDPAVQTTLRLHFTPQVFPFIAEGTQRFPAGRMTMSLPATGLPSRPTTKQKKLFCEPLALDPTHPYVFTAQIPWWSLTDVALKRWVLGFADAVKVIEPAPFRQQVSQWLQDTARHYQH